MKSRWVRRSRRTRIIHRNLQALISRLRESTVKSSGTKWNGLGNWTARANAVVEAFHGSGGCSTVAFQSGGYFLCGGFMKKTFFWLAIIALGGIHIAAVMLLF